MDDVMKKVEDILFSNDDVDEEINREDFGEETKNVETEKQKIEIDEEPIAKKTEKRNPEKQEKQERKEKVLDCIEIFFDGHVKTPGSKIKVLPGCEIETGGLRIVFEDGSVKIYG
jgi:hypothetical protein